MAELFVSYSRVDAQPVSDIAAGLQQRGHSVWWDQHLRAHHDFGKEIESQLAHAECAVVAWSKTARDSLWVRAEANAAWEGHKLVQVTLDGSRPPLPFTIVQLLDFSRAPDRGRADGPTWQLLYEAVDGVVRGRRASTGPHRPFAEPVGIRHIGLASLVGIPMLMLVLLAAAMVTMAATRQFPSDWFGVVSLGMVLAAALGFSYMLTTVIRTYLASR